MLRPHTTIAARGSQTLTPRHEIFHTIPSPPSKSLLPPLWAFEPWAGGGYKRWREGPLKNAVDEQIAVMRRFHELDIPHAALYAEGEGSSSPKLYEAMKPLGIRVLTWNRNQVPGSLERGVAEPDLPFLRRADGAVYRMPKGHPDASRMPRNSLISTGRTPTS